jgi:pimeloyl-ACP methyl ester carboxylesterase
MKIRRRHFPATLAALGTALSAAHAAQPGSLQMRYVDTPFGALHVRTQGEGTPLVLLHWAPASGRLYEPVMAKLAARGISALAFDLPGYGRSYKAGKGFSVEHMAEAILAGATALGHGRFHLLGGHLSASVAAEMAVQAPERILSLTLDGVLLLEPAEWETLLQRFAGKSPIPAKSAEFRAFPFDMALETLREWNPDFVLTDATLGQVYDLMNDYLEMGLPTMRAFVEPDENAPPPYNLEASLRRLAVPTLLLSADREPLRVSFQRATDIIDKAVGYSFEGTHPLVTNGKAEAYAARIAAHISRS